MVTAKNVCMYAGTVLTLAGVWWMYPPLALVLLGTVMLLLAYGLHLTETLTQEGRGDGST